MNEYDTAQKLIEEFIRVKDTLNYANLSEDNKYLGWVSNFNFDRPNGEKMHLDLSKENDKFLLFALAIAWSRTGHWENAASFVAYMKIENKDNVEYWLNGKNIRNEKDNRADNAYKTEKKLMGFKHREKISFRIDIFESMNVLAKNWNEINEYLAGSSVTGDYIPFMRYLRSIKGLGANSNRMYIKIPLILRELRCQNIYDNIPGELCCVPDARVYKACENLDINLPKARKRDIEELINISRIIYTLFGDLYDLPLFAYEEKKIKDSLRIIMTPAAETKLENPIILLDLNYTLVGNSAEIKFIRPFQKKIIAEKYRDWLVDLIKDYYVILITARPNYQKDVTIDSLKGKIDCWMPDEMYFQEENDAPPIAKEKLLHKYILPKYGLERKYLAIESNPKTKKMYEKYQIPSVSVYDEEGIELRKKLELRSF